MAFRLKVNDVRTKRCRRRSGLGYVIVKKISASRNESQMIGHTFCIGTDTMKLKARVPAPTD